MPKPGRLPNATGLKKIKLANLKRLDPELHDDVLSFCLSLDSEEFPEAVLLAKGKYKTAYALSKICQKLKKKRSKEAKKRLKNAEKLIVSMSAATETAKIGERKVEIRRPPPKKRFGKLIEGVSVKTKEYERLAKKYEREGNEATSKMKKSGLYALAGNNYSKAEMHEDAARIYEKAA